MGRGGIKIIKERGDFVKGLLKQRGMTQIQLAIDIPCSPENLSSILSGKRTLTPDVAKKIASKFPEEITAEWLLGFSEYKTGFEKRLSPAVKSIVSKRNKEMAVSAFLNVYGITIELNSAGKEMSTGEVLSLPEGKMMDAIQSTMTFLDSDHAFVIKDSNGKTLKYISHGEKIRFIEDICDYVDMKFEKLTQGGSGNG